MSHRYRTPTLARDLPRSFILDSPKAPLPKRANPAKGKKTLRLSDFEQRMASNPYAAILATPLRMCLYTRKVLPNAFMTRLVQAAPPLTANDDRPWIVPDQILPSNLQSPRFGAAKWTFSGPNILNSVAKEGKYKIMSPSAYMRPDTAELVYAQWTIRVAQQIQDNIEDTEAHKPIFAVVHQDEIVPESQKSLPDTVGSMTLEIPESKRLQCVLCFKGHDEQEAALDRDSTTNDNTRVPEAQSTESIKEAAAFSAVQLPTFFPRTRVQGEAWIHWKGRSYDSVPVYNMELLFQNHPQGLETIRKACLKHVNDSLTEAAAPIRIGLLLSPRTVALTQNLWKLASMHPSSLSS